MNTNTADQNTNQKVNPTYETPEGIFEGMPPIAYPNTPGYSPKNPVIVGGVVMADAPIEYNVHRRTKKIVVHNTGDRPIQVGSHFHFFEINRYMEFDRMQAFGYHLNIPATTAIRFEPGDEKEVEIVAYGGKRRVIGFNGITMGFSGDEDMPAYLPNRQMSGRRMQALGFKTIDESQAEANMKANVNKQTK